MASDIFLKIDGIKGESTDASHKEEIEVLSWSMGASQPASSGLASGGMAQGRVSFSEISFMKQMDKSTPLLLSAVAAGAHIKLAELTIRKAGGAKNPLEYLKIKLTDVMVTSVQHSCSGGGGVVNTTENFSMAFAKISLTYTPQKADGSADTGLVATWDLKANKA